MNLNKLLIEAAEETYEAERFESDSPSSPSRPLLKTINLGNSISSPLPAIRRSSSSPLGKNKVSILEEVSNEIVSKTPQPLPPKSYNDENDQKSLNRRIYTSTTKAESKDTSSTPDSDRLHNKTSSRERIKNRDVTYNDQSDDDEDDDINTLKTKQTPDILKACYYGNKKDLHSLLVKPESIRKVDRHGWNALHWSCSKGYDDILDLLLHHMSNSSKMDKASIKSIINSNEDISGWTPLHIACIGGHLKCIELLLQHGADKAKKDALDEYPVDCIPPDGANNKDIIQLLAISSFSTSTATVIKQQTSHKNQRNNTNDHNNNNNDDDDSIYSSQTKNSRNKSKNQNQYTTSKLRITTDDRHEEKDF